MHKLESAPLSFLDPPGPGIWEALAGDPSLYFDRSALALLERDQRRWSRRWVFPVARLGSRWTVSAIVLAKRLLPQFSSHRLLDRLGVWFMSRMVSEEGGELMLRHFILETNILNFIAANADGPTAELRPVTLAELGNDAVLIHDVNVYELLASLKSRQLKNSAEDYSMLSVPEIDTTGARWMHLDLETGLALMNIAFVLCTTSGEYRRAVHSLALDESLLGCLSDLTGDPIFRTWKPAGSALMIRTNRDVPRELFLHAILHEYAHARLRQLSDEKASETLR